MVAMSTKALSGAVWKYPQRQLTMVGNKSKMLLVWAPHCKETLLTDMDMNVLCTSTLRHAPEHLVFQSSSNEVLVSECNTGCIAFYFIDRDTGLHIRHSLHLPKLSKETDQRFHLFIVDDDANPTQRIFAACGQSVSVIELGGKPITSIDLAHNALITAMLYYEQSDTLITAGADGVIKLWDNIWHLTHIFVGHSAAVTCLLPYNIPGFFLSGSSDCSLRVWSIATSDVAMRVDVGTAITAMSYADEENLRLVVVSPEHVSLWTIRHLYRPFSIIDSQVCNNISVGG